jgi:hypothetical protein
MLVRFRIMWTLIALAILVFFVVFVRGVVSLVIAFGLSTVLALFGAEAHKRGFLRALKNIPRRFWEIFKIMPQ